MRFLRVAIFLLVPGLLSAVEHSGTVRAADQFIPGATITARQGGAKLVTYTDENGRYSLDLTPGVWEIEVSMFGFKTLTTPITMRDQFVSRDWTLEMPRAGEVVAPPKPAATDTKPAAPTPAAAPATAPTTAATPPASAATPAKPATPATTGRGAQAQGRGAQANGRSGRGGRGQPTAQPGFQNADVTATDAGAQALAMAGSDAAVDTTNADTADAFMVNGSTSGGLGAASDQQMAMAGRGGRGGPPGGGVGGDMGLMTLGASLGGPAGDPLGMSGFGAAGADGGFGADAGGGGFGLGGGRGGGGAGGGGGGGGGGRGGGGGGGGGGGRGGGGGGGGRGGAAAGRGGRGPFNGQFSTFGNRRGRGQQSPYQGSIAITATNSALNAAPFSLNGKAQPKPSSATETITGNFGGPIRIPHLVSNDKWSFFLSFTNNDRRSANNAVNTVPGDVAGVGLGNQRAGDFSQTMQTVTVGTTRQSVPVVIYDPASMGLTPFPNAIIPTSRISPAAQTLLTYFPQPTYADLTTQNYLLSTSSPSLSNSVSLRTQGSITAKDRLSFNEQYQHQSSSSYSTFGFKDTSGGYGLSSTVGWTHIFKPRFNNNASLAFSRNISQSTPYFAYKTNISGELGITGTDTTPIDWGPPTIGFNNFASLSDGSPSLTRSQTTNFTDTVTYVAKKNHNLSFGGGYRRMQNNALSYAGSRGSLSFGGLLTTGLNPDGSKIANTGYDFADFLLGDPQTQTLSAANTQYFQNGRNDYYRGWAANAYANDDWRVSRGLTLNIGVRWEYFAPYTELFGHMANLDINPGFTAAQLVPAGGTGPYFGQYPASLLKGDPKAISPRFGFAWRPSQRANRLIRGGYSIFYSGSGYSGFASSMGSQAPFTNSVNLTATGPANPLSMLNFPSTAYSSSYFLNPVNSTYAINPNYQLAYTQSWTVAYQQNLPHNLLMELEYVGIKGTGLPITLLANQPIIPASSTAPLRIPNAGSFRYYTGEADSIMHAAQVRMTRRFTRGMSATALYTFSKSIDDDSNAAQDPFNLRLERALSSNDRRHQFSLNYMLSSPVGVRGLFRNGGWKTRLFAGWTLGGTFTYSTGAPLTPTVGGNLASTKYSLRADTTGAPLNAPGYPFFNLAAFTTPPANEYGDAGRDIITGVPSLGLNGQLNRAWRFGESRKQIQLSFRTNNTLNHVYINSFGTQVNSNTFGLPTGASATRAVTCNLRFNF